MKTLCILILAFSLSSCYISKSLDREVSVRINMNIPVSIFNHGTSNFSAAGDDNAFRDKFVEGMKAEFGSSSVVINEASPEFEVNISEFTITETTEIETVNDTTSQDHGRQFELTKLVLKASGNVVRLSSGESYSWSATKDKEEKVKSNRTVIQLVSGQNKETNEYREKELSQNEAVDLAWNCGRRSGNSVVKEIQRALK